GSRQSTRRRSQRQAWAAGDCEEDIPDRAADDYVQSLFDKFAASFEMQLERLNYKAPELIRNELDTLLPPNSKLDVLDLGCGTGWCGREIKHLCKKLVGVDLSPGMLKKARQDQTYKELFEEEMVQHLTHRQRCYDLMVSSDAIIYLGKLDELFRAAWQRLNASGHLVFTLEKTASEEADFVLEEHGRYSHSQRYISGVLTNAGFNLLKVKQVVVRMEIGEEVQGWMVVAQKPATA
ncbi:MAG: methyltransferase domain-containing protein, partial [Pseudomonadota bacterium]